MRLPLSPLSIAAHVTWAAVSYDVWQETAGGPPVLGISARTLALSLLLIFLMATVLLTRSAGAVPARPRGRLVAVGFGIQIVATYGLFSLGPQSSSPVLLIIVAAEAMLRLPIPIASILMLCLNAAFYWVLIAIWHVAHPLFLLLIYGGFQTFAAVAAGSMKKAQVAADHLRLTNAELIATRALLAESARDGERLRVSRELHDVAGHKLTALSLNLELLRLESNVSTRRELNLAYELSQELLSDIRAVVSNLRRHDGIDLQEALERLITVFPTPKVTLDLPTGLRIEGTERAEAILRCAQEALTNAARHSGAVQAWVSLSETSNDVLLSIEDDGSFAGIAHFGNGLTGLQERVESLRGDLTIETGARGGCRLLVRLPRHSPS